MPARLGHLRLDVADLEAQTAFYTTALGLAVHERATDDGSHYVFLTDGQPVEGGPPMHHRLVLRQARDGSAPGSDGRLDHVAWEVDDEAELAAFVDRLEALGVETDLQTDLQEAQIAWQCYVCDPEGNKLEVYCDRRDRPNGAPLWRGRQEPLSRDRLRQAAEARAAGPAAA